MLLGERLLRLKGLFGRAGTACPTKMLMSDG